MSASDLPIVVVGAGFSGTMTALHLLARTDRPILLCESGERFARGAAYGTGDPGHLLNVRAANMSAFPDRPDDFVRWLDAAGLAGSPEVRATPAGTFVSRNLYGRYLTALLSQGLAGAEGAARLILVADEVVDLVPDGEAYTLVLAGGRRQRVAGAVLAAGNMLQPRNEPGPHVVNPWAGDFTEGLEPSVAVVVVGSGLTMVDVVLRVRHAGFAGPVIAISRRGLLPHTHAVVTPWPTPVLTAAERASPVRLLRRLRREAAAAKATGTDWRSVADSLRPVTSAIWQSFDPAAQARFLRHARPWWDIHRHRMAVPVGREIEDLVRDGRLAVRAGRIESIAIDETRAHVTWHSRSSGAREVIVAQRVVDATGTLPPDQCGHPLVRNLIDRGIARLDRHRLGLDLTPDLEVIGRSGAVVPGFWALGPLGRGVLWECMAVPDIREQAVRVADQVAAALGAGARPARRETVAEAV